MKIGIMTWWHNTNYGGFLQGIALQKYMESQGFDAELVRYKYIKTDFTGRDLFHLTKWTGIRHVFCRPVMILRAFLVDGFVRERKIRLLKTLELVKNHGVSSTEFFTSTEEISASGKYGIVLVGSDQVWSPVWHDSAFSYLLPGIDEETLKVSYASSVGAQSVFPHEETYSRLLKRFGRISVREKSNIAELERLSGKRVEWVVDPVLLLSPEDWRGILKTGGEKKGNFICLYWLSSLDGMLDAFIEEARRNNLGIRLYTDITGLRPTKLFSPWAWIRHLFLRLKLSRHGMVDVCIENDAFEFAKDISAATKVISNSFHALMFSVIFGKDIDVYIPKTHLQGRRRIEDFIEYTGGASLCEYNEKHDVFCYRIKDSKRDREKMKAWICKSKEYLLDALRLRND